MKNPISDNGRAWIYIIGIVVGALTVPISAYITAFGDVQWLPILTALSAAVTTVVATLARSMLFKDEGRAPAIDEYQDEYTYEDYSDEDEAAYQHNPQTRAEARELGLI